MAKGFFTKGNTYNVFETKGLWINKKGMLSISEDKFEKGKVLPEQTLTYIGKKDGKHICLLPDGREVAVHRNHVDKDTDYNRGKSSDNKEPESKATLEERIALQRQVVDTAVQKLADLEAELGAQQKEQAEATADDVIDQILAEEELEAANG